MSPQDMSNRLRTIAQAIDNSQKPNKKAVAKAIQATIRIAVGADKELVDYIRAHDSREPLIHGLINALNEVDELFLKDEGYPSISVLKNDESDKATSVLNRWELLHRQTNLIVDVLRSISPEIAMLDNEIYELDD